MYTDTDFEYYSHLSTVLPKLYTIILLRSFILKIILTKQYNKQIILINASKAKVKTQRCRSSTYWGSTVVRPPHTELR